MWEDVSVLARARPTNINTQPTGSFDRKWCLGAKAQQASPPDTNFLSNATGRLGVDVSWWCRAR